MRAKPHRPRCSPALAGLVLLSAAAARAAGPLTDTAALVDALPGGWVGEAPLTPQGPSEFAFLFERDPDGSLHARTHRDRATFIDLRFVPVDDTTWRLVETAGMAGLGVQSQELVAVATEDDFVRFVTPEDPAFLVVDFALDADRLAVDVSLRGEPHAAFRLERLPDEALDDLRAGLARLAARPVEEETDELEAERPSADERLEAAQDRVKREPADALAHLELGSAALAVLAEQPGRGMFLGGDCVRALERAAQLDPTLAEPHRLLALYRLNAPAIGGGSARKALRSARRYAELEPERGAAFLAEVTRVVASR